MFGEDGTQFRLQLAVIAGHTQQQVELFAVQRLYFGYNLIMVIFYDGTAEAGHGKYHGVKVLFRKFT